MATDNTEAVANDPVRSQQICAIPAGTLGEPEGWQEQRCFCVRGGDYVYGQCWPVDGGVVQINPGSWKSSQAINI